MRRSVEEYAPGPASTAPDGQGNLFDTPRHNSRLVDARKLVRKNDPDTSRAAIERLANSGRLESMSQKVLDLVTASDGHLTYREIAVRLGLADITDAWRRLDYLQKQGLVEKAGKRVCSTNGNEIAVWRATGA